MAKPRKPPRKRKPEESSEREEKPEVPPTPDEALAEHEEEEAMVDREEQHEEVVDVSKGTEIHYVRSNEPSQCRLGVILSDGIVERVRRGATDDQYALIQYGDPKPPEGQEAGKTKFDTTQKWDATMAPDTWHLASECPREQMERDKEAAAEQARIERESERQRTR